MTFDLHYYPPNRPSLPFVLLSVHVTISVSCHSARTFSSSSPDNTLFHLFINLDLLRPKNSFQRNIYFLFKVIVYIILKNGDVLAAELQGFKIFKKPRHGERKERRENRLKSKSTRKADNVCISNTAHKQISCDDIFVQEATGRGIGTRQP